MSVTDLLMSGINLMVIGMGIVFAFLMVLVFTMKGMSMFAMFVNERHGAPENVSSRPLTKGHGQEGMRGDLVAAITAAINSYRATHR
jgi:oxaloacetate decarboxylase gamma subunit